MKKAVFAYVASTSAALAHPGHGEPIGHWVSHADHVVAIAILAVVGALVLRGRRNRQ